MDKKQSNTSKSPRPQEGERINLTEDDRLDEREDSIGPPPVRRPHRDDPPPKAA